MQIRKLGKNQQHKCLIAANRQIKNNSQDIWTKETYSKQACSKIIFADIRQHSPSIVVRSKRLRRAFGALDSNERLCSSVNKEGFASLYSKECLFSLDIRMAILRPSCSNTVSPVYHQCAETLQRLQPCKRKMFPFDSFLFIKQKMGVSALAQHRNIRQIGNTVLGKIADPSLDT